MFDQPCLPMEGTVFLRRGRRSGFTLVEIMIVVVIIALLAAIALPAFIKMRREAQLSAYINDLRQARDAVEMFATKYGEWPADAWPGEMPDLPARGGENRFEGFQNATFWSTTPPIGGQWDYEGPSSGIVQCGISVQQPNMEERYMREIDSRLDDGDLSSGSYRFLNDRYTLILEE